MTHVSIIGTGNMGQAIAGIVTKGGNTVECSAQPTPTSRSPATSSSWPCRTRPSRTCWPSAATSSPARSSSTSPTR